MTPFAPPEGAALFTAGIADAPFLVQAGILRQVSDFNDLTVDNDRDGKHDFGALDIPAVGKVFWKIDLYEDPSVKSEDGSPAVTRVLTIMLADEY